MSDRLSRLNRLGVRMTAWEREGCAIAADELRKAHKRLTKRRGMTHCDLLELADDLATLASPIVVKSLARALKETE